MPTPSNHFKTPTLFCHSCNSEVPNYLSGFETVWLKKCSLCGLVFDSRTPSSEALDAHYRNYSYSSLKPCPDATVRSFNRLLNSFENFRTSGRILDIGCGQGDFLFSAKSHGWYAYGSEYSDAAIKICLERGLEVVKEPVSPLSFGSEKFDVITSFEVIEHIQTPNQLFETARNLLRPGGLFYLTTPNFDAILRFLEGSRFAMLGYPEHLCFYNKYSMRHLALQHGFTPLKITTTGIDLARIKKKILTQFVRPNQKVDQESFHDQKTQTDLMRTQIESNSALLFSKNLANTILGFTGTGDTLKVWLVKDSAPKGNSGIPPIQ